VKIIINKMNDGFALEQHDNRGHLVWECVAADEMALFKELAIILDVTFREVKKETPTCNR